MNTDSSNSKAPSSEPIASSDVPATAVMLSSRRRDPLIDVNAPSPKPTWSRDATEASIQEVARAWPGKLWMFRGLFFLDARERVDEAISEARRLRSHPFEQGVLLVDERVSLSDEQTEALTETCVSAERVGDADPVKVILRFAALYKRGMAMCRSYVAAIDSPRIQSNVPGSARHVDQVRTFHRAASRRYELSGLRTGSISDQIKRAEMLTRSLVVCGELTDRRPLLVIGGGAAGIATALSAVCRGIDVTLLEIRATPFATQLGVSTRWLDPTEFDWPAPHWTRGSMHHPVGHNPYPLPYFSLHADDLARLWTGLLYECFHPNGDTFLPAHAGTLTIHFGIDARQFSVSETDGALTIDLPAVETMRFGAAVSCIGFSGERTSVPTSNGSTFRGYRFWAADPYDRPDLGGLPIGRVARVLVSGGGDGAQQDFLRLTTGSFGRRLYQQLETVFQPRDLGQCVEQIRRVEDEFIRNYPWRSSSAHEQERLLAERHLGYQEAVDDLWRSIRGSELERASEQILAPHRDVLWLVGYSHPSFCYPLNMFLTLLVARVQDANSCRVHNSEDSCILLDTRLIAIDGCNHRCESAQRCRGQAHYATVQKMQYVGGREIESVRYTIGPLDVAIIRHGVEQHHYFGPPPVAEQLLPFELGF